MQHWYVYYKVPAEQREDTIAQVRRLQQRLLESCGVRGRLVERRNADSTTLMEMYEHLDAESQFAAALEHALAETSLPVELRATRRTEIFQDIG